MLVHTFAGDGRPDDVTNLHLPRLATVLNTSGVMNASGVEGIVCDGEGCAALASFTLCLWFNILLKMPASAVINYYISAYVHNALLIREWRSPHCLDLGLAEGGESGGLGGAVLGWERDGEGLKDMSQRVERKDTVRERSVGRAMKGSVGRAREGSVDRAREGSVGKVAWMEREQG